MLSYEIGDRILCVRDRYIPNQTLDKDFKEIMIELSRFIENTLNEKPEYPDREVPLWQALANCIMYIRDTPNEKVGDKLNEIADKVEIMYEHRFIKTTRKYKKNVNYDETLKETLRLKGEVLNMLNNLSNQKYVNGECILWRVLFLLYDALIVGYKMTEFNSEVDHYQKVYEQRAGIINHVS